MNLAFRALPKIDYLRIEQQILMLSNNERVSRGVRAVHRHCGLEFVAAFHSADMVRRNFFDHINPDGLAPQDRLRLLRPQLLGCTGENLAWVSRRDEDMIARDVVRGWMESPGHRGNLLQEAHTHMGVSVVPSRDRIHVTQLFANVYVEAVERALPLATRVGESRRISFRFYGEFPSADLTMMLELPDKERWVPVGNLRMAKGAIALCPRWSSVLDCHVEFTAISGRGEYRLFAGKASSGEFCPMPIEIRAI
jgi:hypothetical protein